MAGLAGLAGAVIGGVLSYAGTRSLAHAQQASLEKQLDDEQKARRESTNEARRVARHERVEDDLRVLSTAIGRFEAAVEAFAAARLDRMTDNIALPSPTETDLVAVYVARAELEASIQRLPLERPDTQGQRSPREQGGSESLEGGEGSAPRSSTESVPQPCAVEARAPCDWSEVWDQLVALVSFWPSPPAGACFLDLVAATERDQLVHARERFRSQVSLAHDALRVARSFPDPEMTK